jgi:hypothetical protein
VIAYQEAEYLGNGKKKIRKKKGKWENVEGKNTLEHLQEALYMALYHKLQNFEKK